MADQAATISLQTIVKRFILKYKINEDDFINYLEHAADCFRDLNISHLSYLTQADVILDAVGKVSFPTDMIDFIAIGIVQGDVFYTFMQSPDLNVPASAVSYDSGGWNKHFYYPDWVNRVIYCQSLVSETVTLRYISSGISTTAETMVPIQCTQVIDAYLRWMQSLMNATGLGEQQLRKANYDESVRHLKWQQLPTMEQFKDTWLGRWPEGDNGLMGGGLGTTSTSGTGTGDMNSYTTTVDLVAGANTVTTTLSKPPYTITIWDANGDEIGGGMQISVAVVGGVYVLNIYTTDAVDDAIIYIVYKP
jgi:hypothetical protein